MAAQNDYINIIFDGPPGPESGRFVEVEDDSGRGIRVGEWIKKGDFWSLRIPINTRPPSEPINNSVMVPVTEEMIEAGERVDHTLIDYHARLFRIMRAAAPDAYTGAPVDVIVGDGNILVTDIHNEEEGWAGVCFSAGGNGIGVDVDTGAVLDTELNPAVRILSSSAASLDVLIAACERAKVQLNAAPSTTERSTVDEEQDDRCSACGGSGYQGAYNPPDTPMMQRTIGCWPCGQCNGSGKEVGLLALKASPPTEQDTVVVDRSALLRWRNVFRNSKLYFSAASIDAHLHTTEETTSGVE